MVVKVAKKIAERFRFLFPKSCVTGKRLGESTEAFVPQSEIETHKPA